jgi:hypothetical protein
VDEVVAATMTIATIGRYATPVSIGEKPRSCCRYRVLGSVSDAEDAVQEAWLRLSGSDPDEIENLGGWLTTVVPQVSLDMLRARDRKREDPPELCRPRLPAISLWVPALVGSAVCLELLDTPLEASPGFRKDGAGGGVTAGASVLSCTCRWSLG